MKRSPVSTRWLFAACLLFFLTAVQAADPDYVAALVKGGATQLASRVLESEQKSTLPPEQWVRWERQRLAILRAMRDWDGVMRRVDALPENVPSSFRQEAIEMAADARLAANDSDGARRYLRQLLWREHVTGDVAARARRTLIRSYMQEDNLADAQLALVHYKKDYQAKTEPWQVLHAEILLRAGDPRGASNALAGLQSYEARLLRLAAALHAKTQSPRDVLASANKLAESLAARPSLQRNAWGLAAEAAERAGDYKAYVFALEHALSAADSAEQTLYQVNADNLWQAYDKLAEYMGNAAKLLVGDDDGWLNEAETVTCTEHHRARAIYAFLAERSDNEEVRVVARRRLAAGLMRDGHSRALEALYTKSSRYPSVAKIPPEIRYALADKAIADFNIHLAAQLVRDLDRAPDGQVPEEWALRRARVMVYAGDYQPAIKALDSILETQSALDADLVGRLLQVLFDLQAVERHDDALRLLETVYARTENDKLRRELLFWMADSQNALKRYEKAAELYLRSATFGASSGDDPWGVAARFHAGETLGRAGLAEDARRVYLKLLEVTKDPRQRAQIERQVQQLWLTQKPVSTQ